MVWLVAARATLILICLACLAHLLSQTTGFTKSVEGAVHKLRNVAASSSSAPPPLISCHWSPKNYSPCLSFLSSRLPSSQPYNSTHSVYPAYHFFGDSTMMLMFHKTTLQSRITASVAEACPGACRSVGTGLGSCRVNPIFGLPSKENWAWTPPNYTVGEGPVGAGVNRHHCQDCNSCKYNFLICGGGDNTKGPAASGGSSTMLLSSPGRNEREQSSGGGLTRNVGSSAGCQTFRPHGAYFATEFVRDVEFQTPRYDTTQENLAWFFSDWLRKTEAVSPVCVMSIGIHDAAIPGITDDLYVSNLEWFLALVDPYCGHFVWIYLTAPMTGDFPQTVPLFERWNARVLDLLQGDSRFRDKSSILDGFNASKTWPHLDNIHMRMDWYNSLAAMFLSLMEG